MSRNASAGRANDALRNVGWHGNSLGPLGQGLVELVDLVFVRHTRLFGDAIRHLRGCIGERSASHGTGPHGVRVVSRGPALPLPAPAPPHTLFRCASSNLRSEAVIRREDPSAADSPTPERPSSSASTGADPSRFACPSRSSPAPAPPRPLALLSPCRTSWLVDDLDLLLFFFLPFQKSSVQVSIDFSSLMHHRRITSRAIADRSSCAVW